MYESSMETWTPLHAGVVLALPLLGSGLTASGLHVMQDERTLRSMAVVLAVHQDDLTVLQPGCFVVYEEGATEDLRNAAGEEFVALPINRILHTIPTQGDPDAQDLP